MKNFITRLFTKKFKVRVRHYVHAKYVVEYCHYRFIPFWWQALMFWFDQGHPGGTECWSTDMWDYETAEKIAAKFKSMEDVRAYYKPHKEEEKRWKEAEKKYWEKNAPYRKKMIKK